MECQLDNHDFFYPYIIDRRAFNSVINDKPRRRNSVTSCFQTNPGCVCNTMMAASVFDAIVEKTHCQRVFDIVILYWPITWSESIGCYWIHISDNARKHFPGGTFLHTEKFLPWPPERSPDLSPIENVWLPSDLLHIKTEEIIQTRQQQQKIDMDPELYTPKIENDCCDRDVWIHLRLFIGHDNNNRKLTWTQNFTHPR
ncbi:hypothetical protein LAZ67_12001134 [Cordylochernes scorpioides]|uniref:Uncharacterized protein n=1 Tax=Cordylochernes scorpioides TaxID=51811 RepID=A0ABY6L5X0_9ARAC|nr:hypothetical protein LAZ67_12001134 [Cordylochernes scorpioides]